MYFIKVPVIDVNYHKILFFPRDSFKIRAHNSKQYTNLEKLSPLVRTSASLIG